MLSQVFAVVIGVSFMVGPSTATIAGETECHRQYQDNYQPLYGSCTAFSVLTACVEAEMPQDNIGVRGDMQERLDSKQPAICEDLDNCTGLIIRPEMCQSVTIASSGNLNDEIAAMVVVPIALVLLIVLAVRSFGSHRMPRIDPAKALHAMSIAHVITNQTNPTTATHSQPPMGLPKIIGDDDDDAPEFSTSMHKIPEETDEGNTRDSDDDYINIVSADEEKEESNGNTADDDDGDDDDDENNSASDDEEI